MTKKTFECISCSCEATIDYDFDNTGEEPQYCPFCGSSYIEEDLDNDMNLLKGDGLDDDMEFQW